MCCARPELTVTPGVAGTAGLGDWGLGTPRLGTRDWGPEPGYRLQATGYRCYRSVVVAECPEP